MTPPKFDRLAPLYAGIEAVSFGKLLHWCRTALLEDLVDARRVLILGEGDGRFLADFLTSNRVAVVDVMDASAVMLDLAQRRTAAIPDTSTRVHWHVTDARTAPLPAAEYDLVITNFFLDCFPAKEIDRLVSRIVPVLSADARWLVGDFALPVRPVPRVLAKLALAGMYAFFGLVTRIPGGQLADPSPILHKQGFQVIRQKNRLGGFLESRLWQRRLG